ncbi:hypothetical protein Zm00014a_039404 [Zea mays]|uniref:U1-type domain-containing protein n=3 Tax=Zea mays TaxID=4577 RepID=B4F8C1_MAIZE|nr:uncharacterized protein LOC100191306 [Zea mays]ACF78364.1 unknown [Zea mays]AQK65831.1 hypothetical protein ZEAMMB73_Zm00001d014306 [Zea mays]PWZ25004.1 hypothetical protein Zm00014a_039404 [Zea mays]|eukprot:NP_001130212.1 uncharacterized protein LOC100191306 [Zea mays]
MNYAAAATNAPAAAPAAAPASGTEHAHYPYYAGYSYPYGAYHQPAPPTYSSAVAAASSSYYYPVPAAASSTAAQYDPYSGYQHYSHPEGGGSAGAGLVGCYSTVGEALQQAAVASTTQAALEATTKEAGKQFGFDPQSYAQAAVARASNGITQPAAAPGLHHAQWNAHFGYPVPKYVLRKQMKKKPKTVQPAPCEVCKIQCDTLEVLLIHKQGKKHKKNLEKLQDSITRKPIIKPPSNVIGPSMPPVAVSNCVVPSVQPKKKSSSAATREDLEVKKRRVLEAGAAQGEVKICQVCNVVVNSQKVYEFHIAGQKHQALVRKQQPLRFVT